MSVRGEVRTENVLICLLLHAYGVKPNESKEGHFSYSILVPICMWSVLIFLCTKMYMLKMMPLHYTLLQSPCLWSDLREIVKTGSLS